MDFAELERTDIEAAVARLGLPRFHGRQLFRWIYQRGAGAFETMTDLPRSAREMLDANCVIGSPAIAARSVSDDGTTKFLLRLGDGRHIEAVYIPDTPAQTFCLSTQVGCAMGCGFCLTGRMGLVRHLSAGEIAGQARLLAHATGLASQAFNIVLMGMGEPLHNYDATMKALRILTDRQGLSVPPSRITLSTVGLLPALARLATEPIMPNLAISLHATTDAGRTRLVPLNRRYDLEALLEACRAFPVRRRARITFEYVLLEGVNDSPDDARRLARLLGNIRSKVNLLPLNEAPGIPFTRPSDATVDRFARVLAERGVRVSVRKSRGRDIRAACGQLIVEAAPTSPAQDLASRLATPRPIST
jgi:23S rRNA (adenine2503-C2)-methyltransferase